MKYHNKNQRIITHFLFKYDVKELLKFIKNSLKYWFYSYQCNKIKTLRDEVINVEKYYDVLHDIDYLDLLDTER